jgi:ribonuclease Z
MKLRVITAFLAGAALTIGAMILIGAGGTVESPTGTAPDRYAYYPGTEDLDKDEIRLIACGTGLPAARS